MKNLWGNLALAHRNAHAFVAVVLLAGILIWALVMKGQNDANALLSVEKEIATVVQIQEFSLGEADGTASYLGVIEVAGGQKVKLVLPNPLPAVGGRIPVKVETYEDGSKMYAIDQVEWVLFQAGE